MLELIIFLLIGHLVSDYLLQNDNIAIGKNRNINKIHLTVPWYYWLITHSSIHGLAVFITTGHISLCITEIILHTLIDYTKCEGKISLQVDQILHVLCKVIYIILIWKVL